MNNETFTLPRLLIAIAVTALVSLGLISLGPVTAHAQSLSYSSGQPVVPGYEGWQEDADGSKYFLFGYMNRNWEEELDIPVGADNGFAPGNADQGQPTHFLPRRNRFVFRVPVPKSFTDKDELIWTITSKGKTEKAYASLRLQGRRRRDGVGDRRTGRRHQQPKGPRQQGANRQDRRRADANRQSRTAVVADHARH
jgi:hypothetical protein